MRCDSAIMALAVIAVLFIILIGYYIYYYSHVPSDIVIDRTPTDTESLKIYEESFNRFLEAHYA